MHCFNVYLAGYLWACYRVEVLSFVKVYIVFVWVQKNDTLLKVFSGHYLTMMASKQKCQSPSVWSLNSERILALESVWSYLALLKKKLYMLQFSYLRKLQTGSVVCHDLCFNYSELAYLRYWRMICIFPVQYTWTTWDENSEEDRTCVFDCRYTWEKPCGLQSTWTKGTGSQSDWYVNRYMRKLQNEDRYVYLRFLVVLVTTKAFKLTCVYLCLLDYLRGRRATCANLEYLCLPVLTCGI